MLFDFAEIGRNISQNLLSPAVLFFVLGIVAGFFKSDLEIPESISRYLAIYLMMAIGFKGGVGIVTGTGVLSSHMLLLMLVGIASGFLLPFIGYWLLKLTTKLDNPTAAAVAAHYGSVSIVTFATAAAFLKYVHVPYSDLLVVFPALMEAPAIITGLYIAHRTAPITRKHKKEEKKLALEIFANGAILLLFGSLLIGALSGQAGMEKMSGFLVEPFQGLLALFLLDMGLVVSKNLHQLGQGFSLNLALFGIYVPIGSALVGLWFCHLLGIDLGTGLLFMVLMASSSYIAVPAAMRLALPEAKSAIYIPLSLGVTFPFNVVIGIPIYYALAKLWLQ